VTDEVAREGVLLQQDTYFQAPHGRLKQVARLRQAFEIEDADLVGGSYCDLASERTS
jgi:adenylate cyclase class IV